MVHVRLDVRDQPAMLANDDFRLPMIQRASHTGYPSHIPPEGESALGEVRLYLARGVRRALDARARLRS